MDTIKTKTLSFQHVLRAVLGQLPALSCATNEDGIETHAIFDDEQGRYMVYQIGWLDKKRIHSTVVYARIHNKKIWIEEDWTENGITPGLLAAGVPKEDVVLGFRHPSMRPLTEFATS